jgi:uncharacterized protein YggT (Ycf19 family)
MELFDMERQETDVVRERSGSTVREESRVTTTGAGAPVADDTEVVSTVAPARRAIEVVYLVFGIIDVLLLVRLVLKLLGASPQASFSGFMYGLTDFMMAPFKGLLPAVASGKAIFEPSVVVAIVIYALVALMLAKILEVILSRRVTVAHRRSSRDYRPDSD